jgi:hypothetical protein
MTDTAFVGRTYFLISFLFPHIAANNKFTFLSSLPTRQRHVPPVSLMIVQLKFPDFPFFFSEYCVTCSFHPSP